MGGLKKLMLMVMEEITDEEWGDNPLERVDKAILISNNQVDESFDLIETKHKAKKIVREMELALDDALQLRGILSAINDPLALKGEKEALRQRFMEIEVRIRAAIIKARDYQKKQ